MAVDVRRRFLNVVPQSADVRDSGLDFPVDPDGLPVPVLGGTGAGLLLLGHRRLLLLPALVHGRQEDRPQVLPREGQGVGAQGARTAQSHSVLMLPYDDRGDRK